MSTYYEFYAAVKKDDKIEAIDGRKKRKKNNVSKG